MPLLFEELFVIKEINGRENSLEKTSSAVLV
jgi:hypothetical protein